MKVPQSLRDLIEGAESLVYIEDLSNKKGLLQAVNPTAKLISITAIIVASLFIFNLSHLLALCAIPIALAVCSRVSFRQFFYRTTLIPLFAAFITIPVLFLTSGDPVFSANIGTINIVMTSEGITRFLVFSIRVWFCVASLTLLVLSTGFDKILTLLASLKVPNLVIQLFSLTYRYFFVSIHEVQSVLIAKEARTYNKRLTINIQSLKDLGSIISNLFIRTYERSERVYLAMKSRGFVIENKSKPINQSLRAIDFAFALLLIIPVALLALS
jgi:cobalt/nickel transport system permease protein